MTLVFTVMPVPTPPNAECPPANAKVGAQIIAADNNIFFAVDTIVSFSLVKKDYPALSRILVQKVYFISLNFYLMLIAICRVVADGCWGTSPLQ